MAEQQMTEEEKTPYKESCVPTYKKYYQANKELVKQKNLARYHSKKQEEQRQLEMQQRERYQ